MKINWHCKTWDALSKEELYAIIQLRIQVFVIEQNCPYQDLDGKDLKSKHLFALAEDGSCVACARLVPPGVSYANYSIGRVVSALHRRGEGIGRELMVRCIAAIREEKDANEIRISAQLYLKKFYESLGFIAVGEVYPEDNIPHIQMYLNL